MKLSEIGGALAPIPVLGVDDLYLRADFTWEALKGFDPNVPFDRDYAVNLLTALVDAKMLLFGDDHKVASDSDVKANPPLVIGKIAMEVVTTLSRYGVFLPKREGEEAPKSSTAKTPTSRRRKAGQ